MMEGRMVVVCCAVGFLGLLSAATGFAAEAKRIKSNQVRFPSPDECIYPKSPALELGLTAAVSLLIAQIILNTATGCICCGRGQHQPNSTWTVAFICYVVSWFTFVLAFLLLLMGAALNDQNGEESLYFANYYCYVVKPGVFSAAAVLSLASVALGIFYYLSLTSEKARNGSSVASLPPSHGAIAMGQPQFPTQNAQGPVFVHEDTYMRRQLV